MTKLTLSARSISERVEQREARVDRVENRRTGGEKLYTCKESAKSVKTVTTKIYIKETKEKEYNR